MAAAPELEPEAEVTIKALPQVGAVALLAVTLGIILAVDAIVRGFFGTIKGAVGWIPYLGHVVSAPIRSIEHKVVSFLGGLEADVDSMMAHHIHQLARLVELFWRTLERLAVYTMLVGALAAAATANYVVGPIERFIHGLIRKVEADIHYLERHLHGATVVIRKTITHVIMPQLKAATVSVPRYVHRELLTIREDALHAEKVAQRALRSAHRAESKLAHKPFAKAVAVALAALGLDWLRCKSNPFNNNKNACSLWRDLEGLLTAAGLVVGALSLVELAREEQKVVGEAAKIVRGFWEL